MKIIYCDDQIIVCIKPAGALSTDEPGGMPELIRQEIGADRTVRTVHRLDSVVSGLMVYALSKEAASRLSDQMEDGSFHKEYMAVIEGQPEKEKGELRDFLERNPRERKTYVTDRKNRNAQEAILQYHTCAKTPELSLVRVKLITGRTHQIRCQFSSRKLPLYGDRKYGSVHGEERIALWSCYLAFRHPVSGEAMQFTALPPARNPWTTFPAYTEMYEDQDLVVELKRSETFSDCPFAEDCGFCAYQGMEYAKQSEKKQRKTEKWLREFGTVETILPMESPFGYRNKTTWNLGKDRNGRPISGIMIGKTHRFLRIGHCRIDHPKLSEIMGTFRTLLLRHPVEIYDEKEAKGWLRQITLRIFPTGAVMVILNAVSDAEPEAFRLAAELAATHPEVRSILLEVGESNGRSVQKRTMLWGADHLTARWMDQEFDMNARSFFPLNPVQSELVYRTALSCAELNGEERVLDVSCGVGVLAITAAAKAKRILAVEASKNDVREAGERARKANIENIKWINSEPEQYLAALARSREKIDVLFFEANRCRNTADCISAIKKLAPGRIVYISGNPEQMSRELKSLTAAGYAVEKIRPVDILPFTEHVETVCLLSKLSGAKNTIDVKVDMDELDVTSAETKATYEEIKAYVLEQTGLQVSSLYIAQVKRECGIIERENYNKAKAEESRQQKCPAEKIEAIKAALKHFGMIC